MDSYRNGQDQVVVRIRAARPADRAAVLAMTRDVWDGHDYMPFRWHHWLASPNGYLYSAVQGEEVVGLGRVREQEDGTAWIEGIRVDPNAQSRGVGTALVAHGIKWAREQGCPRARLSTANTNIASTRMAEAAGLHVAATFFPMRAGTSSTVETPVQTEARIAFAQEAGEVWDVIERFRAEAEPALYTEGWTAHAVTPQRIRMLCARQCVAVCKRDGKITGAAVATCAAPFTYARLGLIVGEEDVAGELAHAVLCRAAQARLEEVRATVALGEGQRTAMRKHGFEDRDEMLMLVHQIDLRRD